jgi:hypothetical protein
MVTILRLAGFRIVIFSDDHEPAHVHVFELIWAVGMKHADVRKCMRLVEENRETLLAYWDEIHG